MYKNLRGRCSTCAYAFWAQLRDPIGLPTLRCVPIGQETKRGRKSIAHACKRRHVRSPLRNRCREGGRVARKVSCSNVSLFECRRKEANFWSVSHVKGYVSGLIGANRHVLYGGVDMATNEQIYPGLLSRRGDYNKFY